MKNEKYFAKTCTGPKTLKNYTRTKTNRHKMYDYFPKTVVRTATAALQTRFSPLRIPW